MGISRTNDDEQTITSRLFQILNIKPTMVEEEYATNDGKGESDSSDEKLRSQSQKQRQEEDVSINTTHQEQQSHYQSSSTSHHRRARSIQFNSSVDIVTIPSHTTYPDTVKKNLYSSSDEIKQNAQRNRREFAAEQWKWENVVEEDQMFFDKRSKEHIHPVHLGGIMDLMR